MLTLTKISLKTISNHQHLLCMNLIINKQMNQTYYVGGRHYSETINKIIYEKINPRTNKVVKIIRGECSICSRNKSQILTK